MLKQAAPAPHADPKILEEMDLPFVSLVDRGANRQSTFLMVKVDDTPPAAPAAKAVPAADASVDDKRAAQQARSTRYGIEALADNASLSYPAGAPTTETLYGDPVNLKYPFGGEDNVPDADRVRNALARFRQAADTYQQATSRGKVYARIVEQALALGIAVSYDPADPIDALLPAALAERLSKAPAAKGEASLAWCAAADRALAATAWATLCAAPAPVAAVAPPLPVSKHEDARALRSRIDELQAACDAQARDLEAARQDLRKQTLAATRRHQRAVGGPSGLTPRPPAPATGADPDRTEVVRAWRTGQPLKPRTTNEERKHHV